MAKPEQIFPNRESQNILTPFPDRSIAAVESRAFIAMKKTTYRRHRIDLLSEKLASGGWVARAVVLIEDGKVSKKIPIYGRRRVTFDTKRQADTYALELAKLWVDGKIRGGNGQG